MNTETDMEDVPLDMQALATTAQVAYDAGYLAALKSVKAVLRITGATQTLKTIDLMIESFQPPRSKELTVEVEGEDDPPPTNQYPRPVED